MKKLIYIIFIIMLLIPINIYAKETVKLSKCVDGDTAKFIIGGKEKTVRFLAIDTEESVSNTKENTYMGKLASEYTCLKLKTAKKIQIEYDDESDKVDKYDRVLAWVFVDGDLLQEDLVKKGYAKVEYLYGDYKYTGNLQAVEVYAQAKKLGIWKDDNYIEIIYNIFQKILKIFT